jgi:hypothetical protein
VDAMIMIIRIEIVLVALQMTTGISRRSVIMNNSSALAVRLIKGPE